MTSTSPVWGDDTSTTSATRMLFPDRLESTLTSKGGRFAWHMNPSTRPVVAGRDGRNPTGPPQASIPLANPAGAAGREHRRLRGRAARRSRSPCRDRRRWTTAALTVHIQWTNPETDWDIYITDSSGEVVTQSASFGDTNEDAMLVDPPPGQYTAHVENYDQVDGQPVDDWSGGAVQLPQPDAAQVGPQGGLDPDLRGPGGPPARDPPGDRGPRREGQRRQGVLALGGVRRQAGAIRGHALYPRWVVTIATSCARLPTRSPGDAHGLMEERKTR